jgi:hypothetical protein
MPVNMEGLTDLSEKGGVKDGQRQALDRRLFMQLLVFGGCRDTAALIEALKKSGIAARSLRGHKRPSRGRAPDHERRPGIFRNGPARLPQQERVLIS